MNIIIDFITGLEKSTQLEQGFECYATSVEALGFDGAAFTLIPKVFQKTLDFRPVFMASSGFSPGFLRHYEQAGFVEHDFTIDYICRGQMSMLDWNQVAANSPLSQPQKNVIQVAREDYGIRNAISIPTVNSPLVMAGASIVSELPNLAFAQLKNERLGTLNTITRLFSDRVLADPYFRKPYYLTVLQQLSSDEKKMLQLISNGYRLKQSQDLYGISPTRAGNILSTLYTKLQVNNASELAYLIGLHQMVSMF